MKKKLVGIFILMLLITTAFPAIGMTVKKIGNENPLPLQNGDVDQQQTTHCGNGIPLDPENICAQSFKPTKESLSKVQLWFFKYATPPDDDEITVKIRDALDGEDLTTITISGDEADIKPSGTWVTFDFNDISTTPEETYYIICSQKVAQNCYGWLFDEYDKYTRGQALWSGDFGASWHPLEWAYPEFTEPDFCFMTHFTNFPPELPDISGPTSGMAGIEYNYTFTSTDPDGDDIGYLINWGDANSDWIDYNASGTNVKVKHTWIKEGTYIITAKAKDIYDAESGCSEFEVTIPRNRAITYLCYQWILERFPLLERLLNLLR